MTTAPDFTLCEQLIVAASEAWRDNGELVATGIGPAPRLAAGLAKLTHTPELMMTDGEAYLVEDPVPLARAVMTTAKPRVTCPSRASSTRRYGRASATRW